jgi:hypothetical protein
MVVLGHVESSLTCLVSSSPGRAHDHFSHSKSVYTWKPKSTRKDKNFTITVGYKYLNTYLIYSFQTCAIVQNDSYLSIPPQFDPGSGLVTGNG